MKQNIYDNPDFFAGYKALRDNDTGLNGVLEEPAMRELIGDPRGKDVLDLGCGMGHMARWLIEKGAKSVLGVDISDKMLAEAQRRNTSAACQFLRVSAEDVSIPREQYDLIISSYTLHYVKDIAPVLAKIYRGLRGGGRFIYSVEHPLMTAYPEGWCALPDGQEAWPVRQYAYEGVRHTKWFVDNVIKYHRTIETYVRETMAAGFVLESLREPRPQALAIQERPNLKRDLERPPVLMIVGLKH